MSISNVRLLNEFFIVWKVFWRAYMYFFLYTWNWEKNDFYNTLVVDLDIVMTYIYVTYTVQLFFTAPLENLQV